MKLSNTTYDRLKWFALVFIPAFEFLILTLEERVAVLEEVLQEQVMAVSTTNEDEGATR